MSSCKSLSGGKRRRSTKRSTKRSTRRRTSRRGGAAVAGTMGAPVINVPAVAPNAAKVGGKRRHTAKKGNKWSEFVKKVYHKGKKENKDYSFSMALQEASKLKKAGKMHV